MSRFLLASALAAALAAAAAVCATPGHAQSLVCRTVDGNTVCAGPDALVCQTVNGKTICTHGSESCEAGGGKDRCDRDPPAARPQDPMPADDLDADADEDDEAAAPPRRPAGHRL